MRKLRLSKVVGLVFMLCVATVVSSPAPTFTTLVSFNGSNGSEPFLGSLVQGLDGSFYGTTSAGGSNNNSTICNISPGCGTVFKITPAGALTTLYSFCTQTNCTDGALPYGGLVLATDGNLYGTTYRGGSGSVSNCGTTGCGTVFEITPSGKLTTLHSFNRFPDGAFPYAGLVQAADGNFYGTTANGGAHGPGALFKMTPGGTLTTLYSFCAQTNCSDGATPQAPLVQATNGNLYGTTVAGGVSVGPCNTGCGTIFEITLGGKLTTLHEFNFTDGAVPGGQLLQASNGDLYGTTAWGGASTACGTSGCGTVFQITLGGTLTTLYSFCSQANCTDGHNPDGSLIQATDGNFYGTTVVGGSNTAGTAFEMTPTGTVTVLHTFDALGGYSPFAGLLQSTNGIFYGTAERGGDLACDPQVGCGAVFSLSVGLSPFVDTLPTSGAVGAAVIILGNNLTGATSVKFNGTAATFTVVSNSEIQTTVPAGATTGTVQVTTPSGTLNSNVPFQVMKPRKRVAQLTSE